MDLLGTISRLPIGSCGWTLLASLCMENFQPNFTMPMPDGSQPRIPIRGEGTYDKPARFMIEARTRPYMNSCGSCAGVGLQRMLFGQLTSSFSWQLGRQGNWQRRRPGNSRWVVCHILQGYNSIAIRSSSGHWSISTLLISLSVD
jgi:hypothetical protein